MNIYETEKRIVAIYRSLHDRLDTDGIMLADMKWAEANIDNDYDDAEDRYERAARIAREFGCQK